MRPLYVLLFTTSVGLAGCVADDTARNNAASHADHDHEQCDCVKIEGNAIGRVGASVSVGNANVTFTRWDEKLDAAGEYVGFLLDAEGGHPTYYVKAGGEIYAGEDRVWLHPAGVSGPAAHGISYVEVCDNHPPEGECNDPDGCDNEGDDPPYVE